MRNSNVNVKQLRSKKSFIKSKLPEKRLKKLQQRPLRGSARMKRSARDSQRPQPTLK